MERFGSIAFGFQGTYLNEFIVQPLPGGPSYDCAGLYGFVCGGPEPVWRSNLRVMWNTPWSWNAGITWRYFDSVDIETTSSNPQLTGTTNAPDKTLGTRNYIDLVAQWNINKNFTLRGGVNNVFDKDPPITSIGNLPQYNGNTFPQSYDALGRNFFINVTAKF
jgi:outer membrane receptor protein involved in Fe transport